MKEYIHGNQTYMGDINDESLLTERWEERFEKYIEMTEDMLSFRRQHPKATLKEVYECKEWEEPIEQLRQDKLFEIEAYDTSTAVNEFYFNVAGMWLTAERRLQLKNSLSVAKEQGEVVYALCIDGVGVVQLPIRNCIAMIDAIEVYATRCYEVTFQHKMNVLGLDTAEEIKSYDYTSGYPEKLEFNV